MACSWGPSPSTWRVPGFSPGPRGCAAWAFFSTPQFLPLSGEFFCTFPTKPTEVLGLLYTTGWVYYNPNTLKSYKISPKQAACGVAQLPYPIYRHGKACLNNPMACSWGTSPSMQQVPGSIRALVPAGALRMLFSPPSLPFSLGTHSKPTIVLGLYNNWEFTF